MKREGANATLTPVQRTAGDGTALTSGQMTQGIRPSLTSGGRTGSVSPTGQRPVSAAFSRQRTEMTLLSPQQRPIEQPSSRGTLGQRAIATSRQTSAVHPLTRTPPLSSLTQRVTSARMALPEIRAQNANALSNILRVLHRQAGTMSSPALNVLQTADRVLKVLRNQARGSSGDVGIPSLQSFGSGSRNQGGMTQLNPSARSGVTAVVSSQSSSGSGRPSPTGVNPTQPDKETGARTGEVRNTISPSSFFLSGGVPVLTSTPQGIKVTVLNRASKVIQDLLAGYSLDLATKKVIHSVIDPTMTKPAPSTGGTFYVIHKDPLLNLLSLHPVSVNLTQMLQGALQRRSFPTALLGGLGSGPNPGGLSPIFGHPDTTQKPAPQEALTGPQVSPEAFQFLLDFWSQSSNSGSTLGSHGAKAAAASDTESSSGPKNASAGSEVAAAGVTTTPGSGKFQNSTVSPENKNGGDEKTGEGGGGGKATTPSPVSAGGTTANPLLESFWSSLTSNGVSAPLNITSEALNRILDLLLKRSYAASTSQQPQQNLQASNTSTVSSSGLLASDTEVFRELTPDSASAGAIFEKYEK
ncbi:hypothetical protein ACOMHN_053453 [Nucella lapillus]